MFVRTRTKSDKLPFILHFIVRTLGSVRMRNTLPHTSVCVAAAHCLLGCTVGGEVSAAFEDDDEEGDDVDGGTTTDTAAAAAVGGAAAAAAGGCCTSEVAATSLSKSRRLLTRSTPFLNAPTPVLKNRHAH